MRPKKKVYLFNPYNLYKEETSYDELMEKTNLGRATLSSYKNKKYLMKRFNAFLVDDSTTIRELREMASRAIIPDEMWARIPGFPNTVSTYGRVRSDKNNDFMIPFLNRSGYLAVRLKQDGKCISVPIHRLVAIIFLDNKEEDIHLFKTKRECVLHFNGRRFDNRVTNLLWIDRADIHDAILYNSVSVVKICPETHQVLDFYESLELAGEANYISPVAIGNCIKGKTKTSAGYLWKESTWEEYAVG